MLSDPCDQADNTPTTRFRPSLHFTPPAGWNNDPHGVVHVDGRYHLFYQHNPAANVWGEGVCWGHASSEDLYAWRDEGIALAPGDNEVGCWSGSVVLDTAGPTILYTRIVGDDWTRGQVALARSDSSLSQWRREPLASVVEGPPRELSVTGFRDPFVWATAEGWTMLMGAGTTEGIAAAVQYRSSDLLRWQYDGVVAQRHVSEQEPLWTGALWECPQLFAIDGTWVLLVSVWNEHQLHYVAYALGDYDGREFTARSWGRLTHGEQLYATTTFVDADGERCVMSWMRELPTFAPEGAPFAGAVSLPHVLRMQGDQLLVRQHPRLAERLPVQVTRGRFELSNEPVQCGVLPDPSSFELTYRIEGSATLSLRLQAQDGEWIAITVDPESEHLSVYDAHEHVLLRIPITAAQRLGGLVLVRDADILEITVDGVPGIGAARVPRLGQARLTATSPHGEISKLTIASAEPAG